MLPFTDHVMYRLMEEQHHDLLRKAEHRRLVGLARGTVADDGRTLRPWAGRRRFVMAWLGRRLVALGDALETRAEPAPGPTGTCTFAGATAC